MSARKPTKDDPAERAAKGAAQEAIGKLIGDDAAAARGIHEQKAAAADPSPPPERRPRRR